MLMCQRCIMRHRLSVSFAKVKPALLMPDEYLTFVVLRYKTGFIASRKYILDCRGKALLPYMGCLGQLVLSALTLSHVLRCCFCCSHAGAELANTSISLVQDTDGYWRTDLDVLKSVHVYKDEPIRLPQRATSAAKSNCARAVPLLPAGGSHPVHAA